MIPIPPQTNPAIASPWPPDNPSPYELTNRIRDLWICIILHFIDKPAETRSFSFLDHNSRIALRFYIRKGWLATNFPEYYRAKLIFMHINRCDLHQNLYGKEDLRAYFNNQLLEIYSRFGDPQNIIGMHNQCCLACRYKQRMISLKNNRDRAHMVKFHLYNLQPNNSSDPKILGFQILLLEKIKELLCNTRQM